MDDQSDSGILFVSVVLASEVGETGLNQVIIAADRYSCCVKRQFLVDLL